MDKPLSSQAVSEAGSDSDSHAGEQAIWKDYIQLTKPKIIISNLVAAFGGYWLASQWNVDWIRLIYMMIGTALVMACSCVLNNYLDRELDQKMARTNKRALPSGRIHPSSVLAYGIVLGVIGVAVLYFLLNPVTALLGVVGIFFYVVVYTAWLKRTSTLSTVIGSVSGSMPPVIGYTAVTAAMDAGAWILFAILFFWQPPHFWSLGIRRKEEYRAAGFLILPVVKGVNRTKIQMIPYVVLLIVSTILLYVYEYVGIVYLVCSVLLGVIWLGMCLAGFKAEDDDAWAKKVFMFSNNYLLITFTIMILNTVHQ